MIFLFMIYTYYSFAVLGIRSEARQKRMYKSQTTCMILIHLMAYLVMFAVEQQLRILFFYAAQVAFVLVVFLIYRVIYRRAARIVVNHMCMLLLIGFIILTRLDFDSALRQFEIAAAAVVVTVFIPQLVRKLKLLRKFTWVYCALGILALGAVLALGRDDNGAHLSYTVAGITLQPSEFVKIIFVFFAACMLYRKPDFKRVCITTAAAAVHVLILVLSTDLGAALIFFVTYIVMLYVATRNPLYFLGGFWRRRTGCGGGIEAFFPCAGAGGGLEGSVRHHFRRRIPGRPVPVCHRHRRLVRPGAVSGNAGSDSGEELRFCVFHHCGRDGNLFRHLHRAGLPELFPDVFKYRPADPRYVL